MSLSDADIGKQLHAVSQEMQRGNFDRALAGLEALLKQADSNPNIAKFSPAIRGMQAESLFALSRPECVYFQNGLDSL